jgi:hypothetical protein
MFYADDMGNTLAAPRAVHADGLVWPFLVVAVDEAIELLLLLQEVVSRGLRGLLLQGQMHAFMPPFCCG